MAEPPERALPPGEGRGGRYAIHIVFLFFSCFCLFSNLPRIFIFSFLALPYGRSFP